MVAHTFNTSTAENRGMQYSMSSMPTRQAYIESSNQWDLYSENLSWQNKAKTPKQ